MKKKRKNNRGYVLVIVMVTISVVMIFCAALASALAAESSLTSARSDNVDASYAAQAGLDHLCALMMKSYNQNISGLTVVLRNEDGYKVYYSIRRASNLSPIVYSIGCVEKNGVLDSKVSIRGTISQQGNITITKSN